MNDLWQSSKIVAGILSRRVIAGPINVQISIVDACNYRCIMCWEHSATLEGWGADELARKYHNRKTKKSTVMDFDVYKNLVSDLADSGTRMICFAGIGEPLLHRKIVEAVSFAKTKGMNVRLTSNGSLLQKDLIKELIQAGLDDLSISINAGAPDEYGLVHANQDNSVYTQIMENLVWLKEYKQKRCIDSPRVSLSNVISNLNHVRSVDMMQAGIDVGAVSVSYRPLDVFKQTEGYALSENELQQLRLDLQRAALLASQNRVRTDVETFDELLALRQRNTIPAPCFAGWLFSFVLANGDVTYCCVSREVLGNLEESSFKQIWFAPTRKKLNDMALSIHKTQQPVTRSRCFGCERTLQNLKLYRYLWPLWGRVKN